MTDEPDIDAHRTWIGRTEETGVRINFELMRRFRATFDLTQDNDEPGGLAPPGIHWCLAPPATPTSTLGSDGHPARGGFLPPIDLPRRMWAGGQLECNRPLQGGDEFIRTSRIEDVTAKNGRSGPLCFVVVSHVLTAGSEVVLRERQDIVYRGLPLGDAAGAPVRDKETVPPLAWERTKAVDPHPTLLFRYSALTFNGHRIHYDRRYCLEEEGYPGLVVHGPLQATLLLQFATAIKGGTLPRRFTFRSEAPLFDSEAFQLGANTSEAGLNMCILDGSGRPAMRASASW